MHKDFINRNWELDQEADFEQNVKPVLQDQDQIASPAWSQEGELLGWFIQPMYE